MNTRHILFQAYLHTLGFAALAMGAISLLGFLALTTPSAQRLVVLPDTALAMLLLGVLLLAAAHRAQKLLRGVALLLLGLLLYTLLHNGLTAGADGGTSLLSNFLQMSSGLAVILLLAVLGIVLGCAGQRLGAVIGVVVILLGASFLLVAWWPERAWIHLGPTYAASSINSLFSVLLGVALILLAYIPVSDENPFTPLSLAAGALGSFCACLGWYLFSVQGIEAIGRQAELQLSKIEGNAASHFTSQLDMLRSMAERWRLSGGVPSAPLWRAEANGYLRVFPDIGALAVLDVQLRPQQLAARDPLQQDWLERLPSDPGRAAWLDSVLAGGDRMSGVQRYKDASGVSHDVLLIAAPLHLPGQPQQVLLASLDVARYLGNILGTGQGGLRLQIFEGEQLVYSCCGVSDPQLQRITAEQRVSLSPGSSWRLVAQLDERSELYTTAFLPAVFMLFGLGMSFSLMISLRLASQELVRSRCLEQLNHDLAASIVRQARTQALNHRIMQFSQDVLCSVDEQGCFREISPACERVFGYRSDELIGRSFLEHVPDDDRLALNQAVAAVIAGHPVGTLLSRYRQRDGRVQHLLWSADWSADDRMLFMVAHDITPLVRQEAFAEDQRDVLSMISTNRPLSEVLAVICRMIEVQVPKGLCSIQLVDSLSEQLRAEMVPDSADELRRLLASKAPRRGADDARHLWVTDDIALDPAWGELKARLLERELHACCSIPLLSDFKEVLGSISLFQCEYGPPNDEVVQLQASAAQLAVIAIERVGERLQLAKNEQHFRSLYTYNPDAVFSLDLDGHFQSINDAGVKALRLPREALLGQPFCSLLDATETQRVKSYFAAVCGGQPQRYEVYLLSEQGRLLTLDMTNLPILIDGRIVGVFGIAKDISERQRITQALRQTLSHAEHKAEQLRGLSAAAIATAKLRDSQALVDYLAQEVRLLVGAHQAFVRLGAQAADGTVIGAVSLSDKYAAWRSRTEPSASLAADAWVGEGRQAVMLTQDELEALPQWQAFSRTGRRPPMRGWLAVPLTDASGQGLLELSDKLDGEFDEDDQAIALQFAQMTLAVLENNRLLAEVMAGEQRLRIQLDFTRTVTDSLLEGLLATDEQGRLTFVNPQAQALIGVPAAQLVGRELSSCLPLQPDTWRMGREESGEFCLAHEGERILRYGARSMSEGQGINGWVVVVHDVTAEHRATRVLRERNQFFSLSLEMFCMLSAQGDFIQVNPAFAAVLRYPAARLTGSSYMRLIHAEDQPQAEVAMAGLLRGEPLQELDIRVLDAEGATHWLQISAAMGDEQIVYCVARDITERKAAERQLHLLKRSLEASYNGVVIVDALTEGLPVSYTNPAFERITGYAAEDVLGRSCRFFQDDEGNALALDEVRHGLREVHGLLHNARKDGSLFWNELSISPIIDEHGVLAHFVGVFNDITAQKRYEHELSHNASHDGLTGLPNRMLLEDRLRQGCQTSWRYGRSLAVLFIDLDGFKPVNDSFGHVVGDGLLVEVARRMLEQVRPGDTVARMGGDEFIVLLPDLARNEDVLLVTERLMQCIAQPYRVDQHDLHITASIGITLSDGNLEQPMQLIQQADLAMYQAKQEGRNNFQWYTKDLNQRIIDRVVLRNELQKAIESQVFELYYQPHIDGRTGLVVGVEALLRWQHPERGFIPPAHFVPLAEETGQIIQLSQWVLDTACRDNCRLAEQGISTSVAVNISAVHFQRSNFVDSIRELLQKHSLRPDLLGLEITEGVLLNNAERAIDTLERLKELGVGIAIDDFGTGFSSLNYLKRLRIDKVKIDRSFVQEIISDHHDAAITQGIISMAHHLKLKVIAEGVETEPQFAFLKRNHCDEFQGYYFARPMPFAELEVYLREHVQTRELSLSDEGRVQTLLLLDDEENILRALARLLRRDGYKILMATRAQDAFELLAKHDVQVIISDQRMPEMNGTEFFSRVKELHPDTMRIVLSGYTDLKSVTDAINQGAIYKFLTKPWDDEQLRHTIAQAFREFRSAPPPSKHEEQQD